MASDNETSCASDPNFAVICSFLEKFAKSCGITHPNMLELQEMLENSQEVPQPLIDLHVKLLRKARKSVSGERWEKAIIKFCHSYSNQDGWEIERFGYKKARIAVKLRILKMLLELQFDLNAKFKTEVNRLSADELRCQPLGRDKMGQTYWCQLDEDCNLRVYREDLDDETWEVVARDRHGLVQLISQLSSNDPFRKEAEGLLNEDSNSLEIEKPITDTGQAADLQEEAAASPEDDDDDEFEEIDDEESDDNEDDTVPDTINAVDSGKTENNECDRENNDVSITTRKDENDSAGKEVAKLTEADVEKELDIETKKEPVILVSEPIVEDVSKVHISELAVVDVPKVHIPEPAMIETSEVHILQSSFVDASKALVDQPTVVEISEVHISQPTAMEVSKVHVSQSTVMEAHKVHTSLPSGVESSKVQVSEPIVSEASKVPIPQITVEEAPKECAHQTSSVEAAKEEANQHTEFAKKGICQVDEHVPVPVKENSAQECIPQNELVGMDLSKPSKPRDPEPSLSSNIGMDLSSKIYAEECTLQTIDKIESLNESSTSSSSLVAEDLSDSSKRIQQETENYEHNRFAGLPLTATDLSTKRPATSDLLQAPKIPIMGTIPEFSSLPVNRINLSGKRLHENDLMTNEAKKLRLEHTVATNCHKLLSSTIVPSLSHYSSGSFDSEDSTEVGEAVEEPLMLVRGEGSGADCNKGNPAKESEESTEVGEAIEEPLMLFQGDGSGADCETGNPGKGEDNEKKSCDTPEKKLIADGQDTAKSDKPTVSKDDNDISAIKEESGEGRPDKSIQKDKSSNMSISAMAETKSDNIHDSVTVNETVSVPEEEHPVQKVTDKSLDEKLTVSRELKLSSPKCQESQKGLLATHIKQDDQNVEEIHGAEVSEHHSLNTSLSSSVGTEKVSSEATHVPVALKVSYLNQPKSKEGELSQSLPKNPPKLWSIETICAPVEKAKDIEKLGPGVSKGTGSSFLGVVSDSLYGEKYSAKLQDTETAGRFLSGSSSPSKRPSRWDVESADKPQKKGENESSSKVGILQKETSGPVTTSEQKGNEAELTKPGTMAADPLVAGDLLAVSVGPTDVQRTSKSNVVIEPRVQVCQKQKFKFDIENIITITGEKEKTEPALKSSVTEIKAKTYIDKLQIAGAATDISADGATCEKPAESHGWRSQKSLSQEKQTTKDGSGDAKNSAERLLSQGFFFGPGCLMKSPIKKAAENASSITTRDSEKVITATCGELVDQEGHMDTLLTPEDIANVKANQTAQTLENSSSPTTPTVEPGSTSKNESSPKVNTSHSIDTIMMSPHKPKDTNNFPHSFQATTSISFPSEVSSAELEKHSSGKHTEHKQTASETPKNLVSEVEGKNSASTGPHSLKPSLAKVREPYIDSHKKEEKVESLAHENTQEKESTLHSKSFLCSSVSKPQSCDSEDKNARFLHVTELSKANVKLQNKIVEESEKCKSRDLVGKDLTKDEKFSKSENSSMGKSFHENTIGSAKEENLGTKNLNTEDGKIKDLNVEKEPSTPISTKKELASKDLEDGDVREKQPFVLPIVSFPNTSSSSMKSCKTIDTSDKSDEVHTGSENKETKCSVINMDTNFHKQVEDKALNISPVKENVFENNSVRSTSTNKVCGVVTSEQSTINLQSSARQKDEISCATSKLQVEKTKCEMLGNKPTLGKDGIKSPEKPSNNKEKLPTGSLKETQSLSSNITAVDAKKLSSVFQKQLDVTPNKDLKQKTDAGVLKMDSMSCKKTEIPVVSAADKTIESDIKKNDGGFDKIKDQNTSAITSKMCLDIGTRHIEKDCVKLSLDQGDKIVSVLTDVSKLQKTSKVSYDSVSVDKSDSILTVDQERKMFMSVSSVKSEQLPSIQTSDIKNVSIPSPDIEKHSLHALQSQTELANKTTEKPEIEHVSNYTLKNEAKKVVHSTPATSDLYDVHEIKPNVSGSMDKKKTAEKCETLPKKCAIADNDAKSESTIGTMSIKSNSGNSNGKTSDTCGFVSIVSDTDKFCSPNVDAKSFIPDKTDSKSVTTSEASTETGNTITGNTSSNYLKSVDKTISVESSKDKIEIKTNISSGKSKNKSIIISEDKTKTKSVVPYEQTEAKLTGSSGKSQIKPTEEAPDKIGSKFEGISRDKVESVLNTAASKVGNISGNVIQSKSLNIAKDSSKKERDCMSTNNTKSKLTHDLRNKDETKPITDSVDCSKSHRHLLNCESGKAHVKNPMRKTSVSRDKTSTEFSNVVASNDDAKSSSAESVTKPISISPFEVQGSIKIKSSHDQVELKSVLVAEAKIKTTYIAGNKSDTEHTAAKSFSGPTSKFEMKSDNISDATIERKLSTALVDKTTFVQALSEKVEINPSGGSGNVIESASGQVVGSKSIPSTPAVNKTENIPTCAEESKHKQGIVLPSSTQNKPNVSSVYNPEASATAAFKIIENTLEVNKSDDEIKLFSAKVESKFTVSSADKTSLGSTSKSKDEYKAAGIERKKEFETLPDSPSMTSLPATSVKAIDRNTSTKGQQNVQSNIISLDNDETHRCGNQKNLISTASPETGSNITEKQSNRHLNITETVLTEKISTTDMKIDVSVLNRGEVNTQEQTKKMLSALSSQENVPRKTMKVTDLKSPESSVLPTKLQYSSNEKSEKVEHQLTSGDFPKLVDDDKLMKVENESIDLSMNMQVPENSAEKVAVTSSSVLTEILDKHSELCTEQEEKVVADNETKRKFIDKDTEITKSAVTDLAYESSDKCSTSNSDKSQLIGTEAESKGKHDLKSISPKICSSETENIVEQNSKTSMISTETKPIEKSSLLSGITQSTQSVKDKPCKFQVPSKEPLKNTSSPKSPVGKKSAAISSKAKSDSQSKGRRKSVESISMGIMMSKLAAKSSLQEPVSSGSLRTCEQISVQSQESGSQSEVMFAIPNVTPPQETEKVPRKLDGKTTEPHLEPNKTLPLKIEESVSANNTSSPIQVFTEKSKNLKICSSDSSIRSECKDKKDLISETTVSSLLPGVKAHSRDMTVEKEALIISKTTGAPNVGSVQESIEQPSVDKTHSLLPQQKETESNLAPTEVVVLGSTTKISIVSKTDNKNLQVSENREIKTIKSDEKDDENIVNVNDNLSISGKQGSKAIISGGKDESAENKKNTKDDHVSEKLESIEIKNDEIDDKNSQSIKNLNDGVQVSGKQERNIKSSKEEDEHIENKKTVNDDICVSQEKESKKMESVGKEDEDNANEKSIIDDPQVSEKQENKKTKSEEKDNHSSDNNYIHISEKQETVESGEKDETGENIKCLSDSLLVFEKLKSVENDQNSENKIGLNDSVLSVKKESMEEKRSPNDEVPVPNSSQKEKIQLDPSSESNSAISFTTEDHKIPLNIKEDSVPSMKVSSNEAIVSDVPLEDKTQNDSKICEEPSERDTPITCSVFKIEERNVVKSDTEHITEAELDHSQDVHDSSSGEDAGNDFHHVDDDSQVGETSDEPKDPSPWNRKRGQVEQLVAGTKRSRVDKSTRNEEIGGGSSSEGEEPAAVGELELEGSSDEGESETGAAGATGKRGGSITRARQKSGRGRRGRGRGMRGRSRTPRTARMSVSPAPIAIPTDSKKEEEEPTTLVTTPLKPKANRGKRAPKLMGLDLGVDIVLEESRGGDEEGRPGGPPVRQSRRIAQMKIREEAERRKLEEVTLQQLKEEQSRRRADVRTEKKESKGEGKKRKKKIVESDEDFTADDVDEEVLSKKKLKKKKKRRKKKPALSFNESHPWQSSSGSSTSQEEDDEEVEQTEEEDEDDEELIFKSDHEFSPESDLENDAMEITPTRRARTAQKGQPHADDEEQPTDEHACQKCGKSDHPEWILLCDKCDSGWHGSCLRPALMVIPEGDWFCPPCEHTFLLESLHNNLLEFDRNWKRRENEELRRKRLAYVGISLDNVLPNKEKENGSGGESGAETKKEPVAATPSGSDSSGSDSGSSSDNDSEPVYQLRQRRQTLFSYRFNEYDDLINSAIQDEMEAVKGAGNQGRGKDIATIVKAEAEELQAQKTAELQENCEVKIEETEEKEQNEQNEQKKQKEEKEEPLREEAEQEEMPSVVPKHEIKDDDDDDDEDEFCPFKKFQIRKKHRRLNSLDISSEDDAESDEDFKGSSSDDDEDEYEEGSEGESEDSEFRGRRGKGSRRRASGPVRRSSRARITRFDKEFINDDSEDSEPSKKKARKMWQDSDSEDSDASWRRSKRSKKQVITFKTKTKKKKKKRSKREVDSDLEVYRAKKPKIKYGGLEEDEVSPTRRTRGCKINYQELAATDSEEETWGRARKIESEDEYVANEDEEEEEEDEALPGIEKDSENEAGELIGSKKTNKGKAEKKGKFKKTAKSSPDKAPRKGKRYAKTNKKVIIDSDEEVTPGDVPVSNIHDNVTGETEVTQESNTQVPDPEMPPVVAAPLPVAELPKETGRRGRTRGQGKKQEEQKKKGKRKRKGEIAADDVIEGLAPGIRKDSVLLGQQGADMHLLPTRSRAELSVKGGDSLIQRLTAPGRGVTITLKSNSELLPESERGMLLQSGKGGIETDPLRSLLAAPPVIPPDGELKINEEVPPPAGKRKGRGRGKAAADSSKTSDLGHYPPLQGFPAQSGAGIGNSNSSSVITRMLQAQPVSGTPQSFTAAAAAMGHKYFGTAAGDSSLMPMQNAGRGTSSVPPYTGPPKGMPSPYRQPPPNDSNNPNLGPGMGHYGSTPSVRGSGIRGPPPGFPQTGSMRLRNPPPNSQPHMFHTSHHPMDPSPSGGGPIIISSGAGPPPPPAGSPLTTKPGTPSTSHGTPTPPPPPYSRASSQMPLAPPSSATMTPIVQFPLQQGDASQPSTRHPPSPFPPATSASHLQTSQAAQQSPPPPHQGRSPVPGNFSPYHPPPPANYHYGGYPPPPPMSAADDALPPSAFQGSPYTDHYTSSDMTANLQASDGSNSKSYDEEGGGEFGGLVSYFSSQREDDLDT